MSKSEIYQVDSEKFRQDMSFQEAIDTYGSGVKMNGYKTHCPHYIIGKSMNDPDYFIIEECGGLEIYPHMDGSTWYVEFDSKEEFK